MLDREFDGKIWHQIGFTNRAQQHLGAKRSTCDFEQHSYEQIKVFGLGDCPNLIRFTIEFGLQDDPETNLKSFKNKFKNIQILTKQIARTNTKTVDKSLYHGSDNGPRGSPERPRNASRGCPRVPGLLEASWGSPVNDFGCPRSTPGKP